MASQSLVQSELFSPTVQSRISISRISSSGRKATALSVPFTRILCSDSFSIVSTSRSEVTLIWQAFSTTPLILAVHFPHFPAPPHGASGDNPAILSTSSTVVPSCTVTSFFSFVKNTLYVFKSLLLLIFIYIHLTNRTHPMFFLSDDIFLFAKNFLYYHYSQFTCFSSSSKVYSFIIIVEKLMLSYHGIFSIHTKSPLIIQNQF